IFCVCRIDPIIPFITDNKKDLSLLIKKAVDHGVNHIVTSVMDIPGAIKKDILKNIKKIFGEKTMKNIEAIYNEKIGMWFHADINYRRKIFTFIKELCDKNRITFALCMEYEIKNGKILGLNKEFMTSENCEGINIPIYFKKNNKFYPFTCLGNCLNCKNAKCGIKELAQGKKDTDFDGWKYSDYLKWSKFLDMEKSLWK
ncbi:MAG: hypothetical protein NZ891_08755, partial [bacterium]|nr:hypothetical protein [bacterium]MDW8164812.1 hypothetical protein [Candidatus Omnitrophota bacterium]